MKLFPLLLCPLTVVLAATAVPAAPIDSEATLRAAIEAATNGTVITISGNIELQSSIRITKPLTFRNDSSYSWGYAIGGRFDGELFQIAADGITFENLRLWGSSQTDGLRVENDLVLRDCYLSHFRTPTPFPDTGGSSWTLASGSSASPSRAIRPDSRPRILRPRIALFHLIQEPPAAHGTRTSTAACSKTIMATAW